MKLNTLFVVLTVTALALSACGAPSTPISNSPSPAPATNAPTSAPANVAPTAAPATAVQSTPVSDDPYYEPASTAIPATDAPASAPKGTEAKVQISNFAFNPSTIEIKAGTTVTWTNGDNVSHTVTANDGSFSSGTLNPGDSYSFTFSTAGSYSYHCGFHASMKATVTVTQ